MAPSFDDICKCIPNAYKRIKKNKDQIEVSKIPYESIDLELYKPEAKCVAFRINKKRLKAWIHAILKLTPNPISNPESDPPCSYYVEDKYMDDKGRDVSNKTDQLTVLQFTVHKTTKQCNVKMYTLHLYLSTGLVEIQGNNYMHFCDNEMQRHLDLVESFLSKNTSKGQKPQELNSSSMPHSDLFDIECSQGASTDPKHILQESTSGETLDSTITDEFIYQNISNSELTELKTVVTSELTHLSPPSSLHPSSLAFPSTHNTANIETTSSLGNGESPHNVPKSPRSDSSTPNKEAFLKKAKQLKDKNEDQITKLDENVTNVNTRLIQLEETTKLMQASILNLTNSLTGIKAQNSQIDSKLDTLISVNTSEKLKASMKSANDIIKKVQSHQDKTAERMKLLEENASKIAEVANSTKSAIENLSKEKELRPSVPSMTNSDVIHNAIAQAAAAEGAEGGVINRDKEHTQMPVPGWNTYADTLKLAAGLNEHNRKNLTDGFDLSDLDETDNFSTVNNKRKKHKPLRIELKDSTKYIVVSDSIFREMTPEMISSEKDCVIVAIGGATVNEIADIIENSEKSDSVQTVYIHSGYKDSKHGPTDNTQLDIAHLIETISTTYPKALCYISAVLPTRDNKNRTNIDGYNSKVSEHCDKTSAVYIDLSDTMLSPQSNRQRRSYYYDTIHPNKNGANALAQKIKPLLVDTTPEPKDPNPPKPKTENLVHTQTVNEQGNIFQGHAAYVQCREDVKRSLATLYSDQSLEKSTSIMYCYRYYDTNTNRMIEDMVDDHEHKAGQYMLEYVRESNLKNVFVAVNREYACHIHQLRWEIIKDLTEEAISKLPNKDSMKCDPKSYPRRNPVPRKPTQFPPNRKPVKQWNTRWNHRTPQTPLLPQPDNRNYRSEYNNHHRRPQRPYPPHSYYHLNNQQNRFDSQNHQQQWYDDNYSYSYYQDDRY